MIAIFLKRKQCINCEEVKTYIEYFFVLKPEELTMSIRIKESFFFTYSIATGLSFQTKTTLDRLSIIYVVRFSLRTTLL